MLVNLKLKNFALLRETELSVRDGFTAITGETGAGKTLLVEALSFLAGAKATPDIISDDGDSTVVEGEFRIAGNQLIIIRRELAQNGRSRAFLNDSPIPLKQLSETCTRLYDITSQRAFSHLLNPVQHLDFLDRFAGLETERKELLKFETDFNALKRRINKLEIAHKKFIERRELIEFQLNQIDSINPDSNEIEELDTEIKRLEHFEELTESGNRIVELLLEGLDAVDPQLDKVNRLFGRIVAYDSSLDDLVDELVKSRSVVREIARRVGERCDRDSYDPVQLEQFRERHHQLTGLMKKFGGSFDALLENRDRLKNELAEGISIEGALKELQSERDRMTESWLILAVKVSKIRQQKSTIIKQKVEASLQKLGIKACDFEVRFIQRPEPDGLYEKDGNNYRLDRFGCETVEFFLSTNPGMRPRPLAKVASGGELSRLLLALKETTPPVAEEATVILDEIDAGVSGQVAQLVGIKLRELSKYRQIITITHLPQIAGLASNHVRVAKRDVDTTVKTDITLLDGEERVREIATMLSGGKVTDAAIEQARNLINYQEN